MKGALGSPNYILFHGLQQFLLPPPSHPGINMLHLMASSGVSIMLLKHFTLLRNVWHAAVTIKGV